MAFTDPDLARLVGEALGDAAPPANVTQWRADLARALGVHKSTVENWYYGHSAPDGPGLAALIRHPVVGPHVLARLVPDGARRHPSVPELLERIQKDAAEIARQAAALTRKAVAG